MSNTGKVFAVAFLVALWWTAAPVAEAQSPIRIGATQAQTGGGAASAQTHLRYYQLCVSRAPARG